MAFFDFLKGKNTEPASVSFPVSLGAPAEGDFVSMNQIPDEIFSTGVLGICCGINPQVGNVYAPIDGRISQLADTLHAVGIETNGIEVLLHIGVDTVEMEGDGFHSAVKAGRSVKKGDLLLTVDLEKIRAAGHPAIVIMAVTNSDDFASVEETASGGVKIGESVLRIRK